MMAFLHQDSEETRFSLHDCRADRVELQDGMLSFFFPEGFWVTAEHPANHTGMIVRTGPGRVDYVLRRDDGDDVSVSVFRKLRWPWSLRTKWELPKLLEVLNKKHWQLEFLYQYPGGWDRIIEGWFWFQKKPWHYECQLKLDVQEVRYCWEELTDRQW